MTNNRTARRIPWRAGGAGLASAVLVGAVVTGVGVAQTDRPTGVAVLAPPVELTAGLLPFPADLLDSAVANFTEANQVLSQLNVADFPAYASFAYAQLGVQNSALTTIAGLQSSEELIAQNSAPLDGLANLWFTVVNLGWYLDSQATLSLNQALDSALGNGSLGAAGLANLGLHVVDFGVFGDAFSSFAVNLLAAFF